MSSATADPQRSGVYRAPTAIERVRQSADPATRWIDLSLRGIGGKAELMSALAQRLDLPPTFGANWDALADALQDSECPREKGCVLHLTDSGMSSLSDADRETLMEVLSASAAYWRGHGRAFIVLVDAASELPLWA